MKSSRDGKLFKIGREAIVLEAYPDGEENGKPRYSIAAGARSFEGEKITLAEAFRRALADAPRYEAMVNAAVTIPLEQPEFDAIWSLVYQSGNRYIDIVSALLNNHHRGALEKVWPLLSRKNPAGEFKKWPFEAGEYRPGLEKRRAFEWCLFEKGNYQPDPDWPHDHHHIKLWRGAPKGPPEVYRVTEEDLP